MPWRRVQRGYPPVQDEAFVTAMEAVLNRYSQPYEGRKHQLYASGQAARLGRRKCDAGPEGHGLTDEARRFGRLGRQREALAHQAVEEGRPARTLFPG